VHLISSASIVRVLEQLSEEANAEWVSSKDSFNGIDGSNLLPEIAHITLK